jgi:hypothetical protein
MYHSAIQYLDYDVSTLISETFLPDQVSKNILRATLSVFRKNNHVMSVRASQERRGSTECCKPSSIAKGTSRRCSGRWLSESVRLYLREANLLSKKYKLLKKLRTAMYPIVVHEYDVDIPPRRSRENHQIEWKGMKIKF